MSPSEEPTVEDTPQKNIGPILSTGWQAPSYDELNEMSFVNRQEFFSSLTPVEREEYAQYMRALLAQD